MTSGFGGVSRGSGSLGTIVTRAGKARRGAQGPARRIHGASVQFATVTHLIRARTAAAVIAGALLVAMFPAIVIADAELEQSTPADGATVPSPFDGPIVMTFTAALAEGSTAELLDPDGAPVGSTVVDGPGATMTITFDTPLAAGTHRVRWVAVAEDTHLSRDTFEFTVAPAPPTPAPTPEPTPTPEASATAAPATSPPITPEPSVAPSPSPIVDEGSASGTADVLLPIIVALVVVGAGAVYLLTRRDRPSLPG